jgi:hypothetical protein
LLVVLPFATLALCMAHVSDFLTPAELHPASSFGRVVTLINPQAHIQRMKISWFQRRKLSDVELIEATRKYLPFSRRARWVSLVVGVAFLGLFAWAFQVIFGQLETVSNAHDYLDAHIRERGGESSFGLGFDAGLLFGLPVGAFLAAPLFKALHWLWWFAFTTLQIRKDELLVVFHDRLKEQTQAKAAKSVV